MVFHDVLTAAECPRPGMEQDFGEPAIGSLAADESACSEGASQPFSVSFKGGSWIWSTWVTWDDGLPFNEGTVYIKRASGTSLTTPLNFEPAPCPRGRPSSERAETTGALI